MIRPPIHSATSKEHGSRNREVPSEGAFNVPEEIRYLVCDIVLKMHLGEHGKPQQRPLHPDAIRATA